MKPETESLVKKLREISFRYSSMIVDSIRASTDTQTLDKRISGIYAHQDEDVRFVLANHGVWFPEDHFAAEDMLFFYGFDRSSLGLHRQMFLYDIEKRSVERVELFGLVLDIDWIALGKRHFHGLSDILGDQKSGAQTVRDKAVFYNDSMDAYKQLIELRDMKNPSTFFLRNLGLQDFQQPLDMDDVSKKYERSFIMHEGAHLMFHYVMSHQTEQFMGMNERKLPYLDDTERFAILSQIVLSDLPSYTLKNFLAAGFLHEQYKIAVSTIVDDVVTHLHKNPNDFPHLINYIKENKQYTAEDVFALFNHLRPNDIRIVARTIWENDYARYFDKIAS